MNSVAEVIEAYEDDSSLDFLFFWGHRFPRDGHITRACLSQWFDCEFEVEGVLYHTAEQYMMAQKAKLFGDEETFVKIMGASSPQEYKHFGRLVKNYDEETWVANRSAIVTLGNIHKFSQNEELKRFLLTTGNKVLVEASPYDRIWGIGMHSDEVGISDPHNWKGENLLGFALMAVRDALR